MSRAGRPSFADGLVAAAALSVAGAALLAAFSLVAGPAAALRGTVAALGLAYLLWLLAERGRRPGGVTAVAAWSGGAALAWLLHPPLGVYLLIHVGMVSVLRSLSFCSSPLPAVADLALAALGTAFGLWAGVRTGSALVALWCFFLVQALVAAMPSVRRGHGTRALGLDPADVAGSARVGARADVAARADVDAQAFERAHRAAEAALRRIAAASR
ncbi:MAG TPA: hypothetical protein VFV10_05245 [Gammaproteobacteria bacterium]|nr:hypothetical protein [Gammaproteobacteria bacterium]